MGIETIVLVGLSLAAAGQNIKQAEKEAEAIKGRGEIETKEKAKETKLKAARAKVSFINSGLTLEGTPTFSINEIFDTGIEDIEQIRSNRTVQARNVLSKARNDAISSVVSTATTATGIGAGFGASSGPSVSTSAGNLFKGFSQGSSLSAPQLISPPTPTFKPSIP